MAEDTGIEWCDHTFNPWRGCEEVSPGCANCYAREFASRNPKVLGEWGQGTHRARASQTYWKEPLKWEIQAAGAGERRRVFCGSMMDFFEDRDDLVYFRRRAARLMWQTEDWLDWLLVTKRPQNYGKLWPTGLGWRNEEQGVLRGCISEFHNVWLGVTVEDVKRAEERIPVLMNTPAYVRFLSMEPLLEEIDLDRYIKPGSAGIDWVIVGGESMQHGRVRECQVEWVEQVVMWCKLNKVACFVKQLGDRASQNDGKQLLQLGRKGKEMADWPEHLRVRQFPEVD